MTNIQKEFNSNFSKTEKEIEFKRKNFRGQQLIIKDYPELESLYLVNNKNVDKIVLRNLENLKKCEVFNCGAKNLVIENCPKIKSLDVCGNSLTNLGFLVNLDNLEELKVEDNDKIDSMEYLPGNWENFSYESKLTEILKLYQNNWKACQKDTQQIFELSTKQDFQGLIKKFWDLKKSREDLKKDISVLLSKEAQLKTISKLINTKELILNLEKQLSESKARAEKREKEINIVSESEIIAQSPIYKEAINFLRAKSNFLNARRGTVEELKERCNEVEKFINRKSAKFTIIGNAISDTGKAASSTQIFGVIPNALGEIIKAGNEFSKIKFLVESSEEFQILLKNEDELFQLENAYDLLINLSDISILNLKNRQIYGMEHLFNNECSISDILGNEIWAGRSLDSEDMKIAISSLNENLKKLEKEFNQQFDEFKDKLKFGKEYTEIFIKEKEVRAKQGQLSKLINSAKNKLESKKWWNVSEEKEKRNKNRQLLLEKFLSDQDSASSPEKELLERKLTKEGLDILCHKQKELFELREQLEILQKQHFQIQIPPK